MKITFTINDNEFEISLVKTYETPDEEYNPESPDFAWGREVRCKAEVTQGSEALFETSDQSFTGCSMLRRSSFGKVIHEAIDGILNLHQF
ncbi:MAG: hypothetical protein QM237_10935 [Bacteroidota bacterium]|jgi:hypothetical protein|nr:hypothetical protein [Bacteroidota bacterium]HHU96827.1 hypothetical protein [Petrimonas sp.]